MSIRLRFGIRRGNFALDADLNLPASGITVLFGPSGCGKTSLLRAIAGLDRHVNGLLRVGDATWQDEKRFVPVHRRAIGYVFQESSLFPHLSVRDNIAYGFRRVPAPQRRITPDEAIGLLGIGPLLDRDIAQLSGGERQRVAIARALAANPRLLLMDEPLSALDRQRRDEILPWIESLPGSLDLPVIYVSHATDELARLADHLVLLDHGQVRAAGPAAELLTRLDLPLAHDNQAESIVSATVTGHDDHYHLTRLACAGASFHIPRKDIAAGKRVRLRIAARDVSLTLERQSGTSILNIFPARIDAIADDGSCQVMVRLLAGDQPLLSRITRKSADALALRPGKAVYVQVKSVAVLP